MVVQPEGNGKRKEQRRGDDSLKRAILKKVNVLSGGTLEKRQKNANAQRENDQVWGGEKW